MIEVTCFCIEMIGTKTISDVELFEDQVMKISSILKMKLKDLSMFSRSLRKGNNIIEARYFHSFFNSLGW